PCAHTTPLRSQALKLVRRTFPPSALPPLPTKAPLRAHAPSTPPATGAIPASATTKGQGTRCRIHAPVPRSDSLNQPTPSQPARPAGEALPTDRFAVLAGYAPPEAL